LANEACSVWLGTSLLACDELTNERVVRSVMEIADHTDIIFATTSVDAISPTRTCNGKLSDDDTCNETEPR
jgi:hypothetical protein